MNTGITFFRKQLLEKKKTFPRYSLSYQIALAATDAILHLYPNKKNIILFLKSAREKNFITNDDLENIKDQIQLFLKTRRFDRETILKLIETEKFELQLFLNKPLKFKSTNDELKWLRKDHARLILILRKEMGKI